METKINVAEILKDKPKGLNLYSPVYGKVKFEVVHKDKIYFYHDMNEHSVKSNGKSFDDGEVVIFPSDKMRDWSKFAWKKGDVLVNKDGDVHIIFERFADDTYCSFVGKYYLWKENNDTEYFYKNELLLTSDFQKAGKDAAQTYINTIEERLGGKLNRETLEIEKPEFKDGDFITIKLSKGGSLIGVFKAENDKKYYLHANLDSRGIITINEDSYCKKSTCIARLSTEEEKAAFFDALAKKGKTWDVEKKAIVDLKPKVDELKPFDKVLVRDSESDKWRANLFGYIDKDGYYHCVYANWAYCIPYAGNEHLLGTTKDVEG